MNVDQPVAKLQQVIYIQYPSRLSQYSIEALIHFVSKVNAMQANFARKYSLHIWKTDVGTQKINGSRLETFDMVIASILLDDKDRKSWFFEKTFLLGNISMNIALEMFSLSWAMSKLISLTRNLGVDDTL